MFYITTRVLLGLPFGVTFLLCAGFPAQDFRQEPIHAYFDDSGPVHYRAAPAQAINTVFPERNVSFENMQVAPIGTGRLQSVLRRVRFVTLRAYHSRPPSSQEASAVKPVEHPEPHISAAVYGDEIFIAGELFCDQNMSVVNRLLTTLGLSIASPEEALELAEFYIQFAHYRLADPRSFLISAIGDSAAKEADPSEPLSNVRDVLHPPRAIRNGVAYRVELFTIDPDSPTSRIHRWTMQISESRLIEAREELIYPRVLQYRADLAAEAYLGPRSGRAAKDLRFLLVRMSDGKTPDSARFNFAALLFAASHGPPVTQESYSFNSPTRAKEEMQRTQDSAAQTIEAGIWLDKAGRVLGDRAVVLYTQKNYGRILAAVLLTRGPNFFEISCPCLRNTLEFERLVRPSLSLEAQR